MIKETDYVKMSEVLKSGIRLYVLREVKDVLLEELSDSYPNFDKWYNEKVLVEMRKGVSSREIIVAISELERGSKITGVAIIKKTEEERKICTLKVLKEYRKQGIGGGFNGRKYAVFRYKKAENNSK